MDNYYIDPSAASNGTGTQESPYNSWAALGVITPSFPFTVFVKRGTVEVCNYDFSALRNLVSTSSEQSYIKPYGTGANPVVMQADGSKPALSLVLRKTSILMIDGRTNPVSQSADIITLSAMATTAANDTVNVWASFCDFSAHPSTMIGQYMKGIAVVANRDVNAAANCMGVTDCTFDYLSRGTQVLGNYNVPSDQDPTTNVGDRYRSNGAVVENCSFTNMRDDGAILNRCTSPASAGYDTTNPLQSRISRVSYTSYRANTATSDGFTQAPAVAFWMVYSNRVVIEYAYVSGSYAARADRMAFDFDIMTWDCVIRYCYSHNNAGGLLLFISNIDGDGSQSQPSGTSNTEWFVNRRWGSGNNVMHNCISYNDGTTRAGTASGIWMSKVRAFGYISNCQVRNITMIDTLSSTRGCFIQQYLKFTPSDNVTSITFEDTLLHYRRASDIGLIRTDTSVNTAGLVKFSGCNLYSEAKANILPIPTTADSGGNTAVDTGFVYLSDDAPDSYDAAKLLQLLRTAAAYGKAGFLGDDGNGG